MAAFRSIGVFLLLCGLLSFGCVGEDASARREYKVFCGLSSKRGEVSEEAWRRFCDRYVSAAFPEGYTVLDAAGYWRSDPDTTAQENAKIILIVAPARDREKVLSLAKRYREEFDQESVLISVSDAEMEIVRTKTADGE